MTPLFIFGTGGHAHDLAEIAVALGNRPVFVALDAEVLSAWQGSEEIVLEDEVAERSSEAFALGIGDNRSRAAVAERYRRRLRFPALIHPDTSLARKPRATLADNQGSVLFPGVRVMGGCSIGDFCTLNLNATLSHDCRLGNFANLSPGAQLAGNVDIEEGAWIGMGAVINQGSPERRMVIGAWATVGSGAAVIRPVRAGSTHVGVPAREVER